MSLLDKNSPYHPQFWGIWLGLYILRLIVFLLPYTLLQRFGLWLGRLLHRHLPKRRHVIEVNARLCFPAMTDAERAEFVEKTMINVVLGVLEIGYGWWASDKEILKRSRVDGLDLLNQYLDQGRGVVLVGAHFTTMDTAARVMGLRQKVDATYKNQGNAAIDHIINTSRSRSFGQLIEKKEMRKMLKNLKKGGCVWYAPDQDFGREGAEFVPFFGVQTATITTLTKLVKLSGAKVLFFSNFRQGHGKDTEYVCTITDPFGENIGEDEIADAALMNKALEDLLLANDPTQYLWVHKRFKTRPGNEVNAY
ncbi:MAG: hypothetical protein HRU20_18200 [Pseudomonadales bacterium]|nr:hypothetical protein [Pseudomonadales bacterium]